MTRPIWKGAITFGLVTIPVGLYSATERKGELSFRLLHDKDQSRVEYKRFCVAEGSEVPWSDIVKGYEYEKGEYVVIDDKDFEKARTPATQTIDIQDFVPRDQVEPIYFDTPYYVAPSGKAGIKAYALLRDALEDTGRMGVGTLVMREREHLVAIEPAGDLLAVTTMRWAHEIRSGKDIEGDVPDRGKGWNEKEMKLAKQLVDTLAGDWEPKKYKDTYRDVLMDVIRKKIEGEEIVAPKLPKPRPVVDLVRALEQSLKAPAKKQGARAEGRAATKQRAAGSRRRAA